MDLLFSEYERYQDALLNGEYPYKLRELTAWLQRHMAETAKHPLTSYLKTSKQDYLSGAARAYAPDSEKQEAPHEREETPPLDLERGRETD